MKALKVESEALMEVGVDLTFPEPLLTLDVFALGLNVNWKHANNIKK